MISRIILFALSFAFSTFSFAAETIKVVYIGLEGDPYYQTQYSYTGLSLKDRHRPLEGARLGLKGTRVLGRSLGIKFELEERILSAAEDVLAAVENAQSEMATAILLDLPKELFNQALSTDLSNVLVFNIRQRGNQWRENYCAPNLLHTIPSRAMLSDAMAQHLRFQNWLRILVLQGDTEEDAADVKAIEASARKFGLNITAVVDFKLTNNPRRRDLSNIRLMTSGTRYDVIWLADSKGEFGRYVPFATAKPRPIVGAEGLTPRSWHWTLERYGAPQLNQRFRRTANRNMSSGDWAAWVAVKSIASAVGLSQSSDFKTILSKIRSPDMIVDLYKGQRGSYRSWNGQLRQPILLATHNAVISIAPLDGFRHQFDQLDTLGRDRQESACIGSLISR